MTGVPTDHVGEVRRESRQREKVVRLETRAARVLPWLLVICACAGAAHFAHNAEYLSAYPNLPTDWARGDVYLGFALVSVPGVLGWLLYRGGASRAGLALLYMYACLGFGGLLHYARAPFHRHTAVMNITILAEAAAALALLADLVVLTREASR
jgi:hypothetical protein